jgi:DNA polymerase III epsilon subunit-like protein
MLLIHVDIETTGPCPSKGSMISLGAVVHEPISNTLYGDTFEVNLGEMFNRDPVTMDEFWEKHPSAWTYARTNAIPPARAMNFFSEWLDKIKEEYDDNHIIFVADPVGFDWGFVNYYFWNLLNKNPFGYSPRCISSLLPALTLDIRDWASSRNQGTRSEYLDSLTVTPANPHYAVSDAFAQAQTLQNIIREMERVGARTLNPL